MAHFEFDKISEGTYQLYAEIIGKKVEKLEFIIEENQTTFRLGQNHTKENIILFFSDKDFSRKNIDIFDISGKIVYSGETNDSQTTISISTLPKGVYIVKASTNRNDAFVKRFVK